MHVDPTIRTNYGETCLHAICYCAGKYAGGNVINPPPYKEYLKKIAILLLDDGRIDPTLNNNFGKLVLLNHLVVYNSFELFKIFIGGQRIFKTLTRDVCGKLLIAPIINININIVRTLIDIPATDINYQDESGGQNLLHKYNHNEIAKIILDIKNCNSNISDNNGNTPLHLACQKLDLEKIKLLINHNRSSLCKTNKAGHTPLYLICESKLDRDRQYECIKYIVDIMNNSDIFTEASLNLTYNEFVDNVNTRLSFSELIYKVY